MTLATTLIFISWRAIAISSLEIGTWRTFTQRLCHIKRTGFPGFGFILLKDTENGRHTIIQIEKDSPAESCGLTKGDTIIEVNGVNVEDSTHEEVIQRTMETGDEITLLVMREKDRDKNFDAASSSGTDETLPFVPLQLNPYHGDNDNSINEPAYTLRNTQPVQLQSNFAQSPIRLNPYHAGYNQYTQPSNGNSYPRPDGSYLGYTQPQSTYPIVEEPAPGISMVAQQQESGRHHKDYFNLAVFASFCFIGSPLGCTALYFVIKARTMYENGNIEGSKRNNLWAKYLIALSVTLGLISLIVYWTLHFTVLDPKYRKYVSHLAD